MLVDLALYSGLRVSEMAALKVGDLVFNESDPFIIVRHGKGNKKRTVYIDQKLAKHLKEFINYKRKALNQSTDLESPLICRKKWQAFPSNNTDYFGQCVQRFRSKLYNPKRD